MEATRPATRSARPRQWLLPVAASTLWLAWYAQWISIPSIILPDQVKGLIGATNPAADAITGATVAAGSVIALVLTPLAGALSDRSRSRLGRRRPFLLTGVLASCVAVAALWVAARHGGLALYVTAYVGLQFCWNWAAGPYAAFVPDVLPPERHAAASGWTNALGIVGVVAGNVLVLLFKPVTSTALAVAFVILNLVCLAPTLMVREPPVLRTTPGAGQGAFLRSFLLNPRDHPAFYLVLGTRFLSNMGIWSVMTFLLYYMEAVLGLGEGRATDLLPKLLAAGACLAVPASLVGVWLAERHGLVRAVQAVSWLMAAATGAYVLIALHPVVWLVAPPIILFAIANGAYGAVDWLLALRVLPSGQNAGRDFGIWHVCMVAPQIVAPLSTGLIITAIRTHGQAALAYEAAFAIGALWFVLAAALVGRVRLPAS